MGEHNKAARHPNQPEYQRAAAMADESCRNLIEALRLLPENDPGAIAAGLMGALVRHVADNLVPPLTSKRLCGMVMASCARACEQEVATRMQAIAQAATANANTPKPN
jgi:hypothetical protein